MTQDNMAAQQHMTQDNMAAEQHMRPNEEVWKQHGEEPWVSDFMRKGQLARENVRPRARARARTETSASRPASSSHTPTETRIVGKTRKSFRRCRYADREKTGYKWHKKD
jgi:uncharacterized iron-regulated membrane protein